MSLSLEQIPYYLAAHLDVLWTFILLFVRFAGLFLSIPGLGVGLKGLALRTPAALALAVAACVSSKTAPMPTDLLDMAVAVLSEMSLGFLVGFIPLLVIAGIEMGLQLSTSTMGLGGSSMFDPTTGGSVSSLAKLHGDLGILVFLMLGGHYVVIESLSGLSHNITPGTFPLAGVTGDLLIDRFGEIFRTGIMISAPVIVALLLTQFVMGIISRSVTTVNIFVISFPLTIGIGFIISALALPEVVRLITKEVSGIENAVSVVLEDAETNPRQQVDAKVNGHTSAAPEAPIILY